jgi:hypothetical protein
VGGELFWFHFLNISEMNKTHFLLNYGIYASCGFKHAWCVLLIFYAALSFAQAPILCPPSLVNNPPIPEIPVPASYTPSNDPYHVRVYFHVLRKSNCTLGATLQQVEESFQRLQTDFAPYGIVFVKKDCEVNEICDDYYYNSRIPDIIDELTDNFGHDNGVDIFIGKLFNGGFGGMANGLGGGLGVEGNNGPDYAFNSAIITHEMGHCLGLFHTFHGSETTPFTCELVGFENDNNGDFCADTKADADLGAFDTNSPTEPNCVNPPYVNITSCGAVIFGNPFIAVDNNGTPFVPDPSIINNYMSYYHVQCQNHFTACQERRMKYFLDNHPVLLNRRVPEPNPGFSPDMIDCNTFHFESDEPSGEHTWIIDGTTITEVNPTYDFPGTGMYEVTHTIQLGCDFSNTITETIMVDCAGAGFTCPCPSGGLELGELEKVRRLSEYPEVGSQVGGCVAIGGHFIVDEPWNLALAEVRMQPGAIIEVESGLTLDLYESNLFACDLMWQGIYVNANATLNARSSSIKHAVYAVRPRSGSNVNLVRSTFDQNWLGLYASYGSFNLACYGNNFDCSAPLLQPMSGYSKAGISANNGGLLHIGSGGAGPNVFQNMNNGILAYGNSLLVENASFNNLTPKPGGNGLVGAGHGIYADDSEPSGNTVTVNGVPACTFTNCQTGVYASNCTVDINYCNMSQVETGIKTEFCVENISIENNTIGCTKSGIEIVQSKSAERSVLHNTINLSGQGNGTGILLDDAVPFTDLDAVMEGNSVNVNKPSGTTIGIHVRGTAGLDAIDNTVYANTPIKFYGIQADANQQNTYQCNHVWGTGAIKQTGLNIMNSPSVLWECNETHNTNNGIGFHGVCFSSNRFRGNLMEATYHGLVMYPGARIGTQYHRGNSWSGANPEGQARHYGTNNDVEFSKFWVRPSKKPNPVFPSDWFISENQPVEGTVFDCITSGLNCFTGYTGFDTPEDTDTPIANDGLNTTNALKWLSERYLYQRMKDYGLYGDPGTVFEAFKNANETTSIGQFYEIDQALENLHRVPANTAMEMNDYYQQMEEKSDSIRIVDNLIPAATGSGLESLLAKRASLFQQHQQLRTRTKGLWVSEKYRRDALVNTTGEQNEEITATAVYEVNEKTVNEIYLRTFAKGIYDFDATQLANLTAIAEQCPLEGGNAVFRARGMVAVKNGIIEYDDESSCYGTGERSMGKTNEILATGFSIFPNPAKNEVKLTWMPETNEDEVYTISIYDVLGSQVLSDKAPSRAGSIVLDVRSLKPGVYNCTVSSASKILNSAKITLIK